MRYLNRQSSFASDRVDINKRRLNILISSFGFVDGPGYQRTFKIALELSKLGHNVTYLTSQNKPGRFPYSIENRSGIKEVAVFDIAPEKIKKLGLSFIAAAIKTFFIINKKYDIVHADAGHRVASGLPCWVHKIIHNTKYISEWWDFYGKGGQYDSKKALWRYTYGILDNLLEVFDKKYANGVVALSQYTKTRAVRYGINESIIKVIHGGADISQIPYVPDKRFRNDYDIRQEDFVIVLTGVVGENDFGQLLTVLSEMKNKISIKIITTGKLLNDNIITKYSIKNELIQMNWVAYDEYYKILSLADVFYLYQQHNDTHKAKWPNKIGDYLSAGRLIITNPINDIVCLMTEGAESIIDCDMEAECIKKVLYNLYEDRSNLIRRGYHNRKIAEELSWTKIARQYEEYYLKILGHYSYEQSSITQ